MELKPCPFCGCRLERRTSRKQFGLEKTVYMHPENGCVFLDWLIDGTNMFGWNRRVGEGEKNGNQENL